MALTVLSFIINAIVLFGWMAPEKYDPEYYQHQYSVAGGNYGVVQTTQVNVLIKLLGIVHVILSSMLLANFLLANRPTVPGWITTTYSWIRCPHLCSFP